MPWPSSTHVPQISTAMSTTTPAPRVSESSDSRRCQSLGSDRPSYVRLAGLFVGLSALAFICSADSKLYAIFTVRKKALAQCALHVFLCVSLVSLTFIAQTTRTRRGQAPADGLRCLIQAM